MLQRLASVIWEYKLILAIAIAAGGVWGWHVAQQRSATLMAFDTNTGTVQWFQPLGAEDVFFSRGAIAAGGTVILESASSAPPKRSNLYRLQAFSVQTGDRVWTQQLDTSIENSEASRAYEFASNSLIELQPTALYWQVGDELRSLDPTTGKQRWSIQRRWFNHDPNGSRLWMHLGVAATEQVAVLQLASGQPNSRQQLQFLDGATGKLQRSVSPPAFDFVTNYGRMKGANRRVFTVGSDGARQNPPPGERQSFLTAYNLDTGAIGFRTQIPGDISNLQTAGKTPILTHDSPKSEVPSRIMALDSQTGRLLWQRLNRDLKCRNYEATWQADAQFVYLNCNPNPGLSPEASTIVALSAATGEVRWQTPINPNRHSEDWPMTISTGRLLMLHTAGQGNKSQDQVVALDRQTGKRLWTFALFSKRDSFFRDRIAADGDHLLITDNIPQWQLWLLQLNRGWYWNQAIVPQKTN